MYIYQSNTILYRHRVVANAFIKLRGFFSLLNEWKCSYALLNHFFWNFVYKANSTCTRRFKLEKMRSITLISQLALLLDHFVIPWMKFIGIIPNNHSMINTIYLILLRVHTCNAFLFCASCRVSWSLGVGATLV